MTRFKRLVFMDAVRCRGFPPPLEFVHRSSSLDLQDVLVQANVDDLMELPFTKEVLWLVVLPRLVTAACQVELYGMLDLHDCVENHRLNTGVVVFEPAQDKFERLMKNYENAPGWLAACAFSATEEEGCRSALVEVGPGPD